MSTHNTHTHTHTHTQRETHTNRHTNSTTELLLQRGGMEISLCWYTAERTAMSTHAHHTHTPHTTHHTHTHTNTNTHTHTHRERDTADSHTNLITGSSGREMAVFEWCFIAVETASGCMSPWRLRAQACFSAADDPVE